MEISLFDEAWMHIKSNGGSAGIDKQSISDFEKNLKDNHYRIWNRMSSGSYMPSAVKLVEIPKSGGGKRPLEYPDGKESSRNPLYPLF